MASLPLLDIRLRRPGRRTQGQAKAEVDRAERRVVRVAVRRPARRRDVVPTAATAHAARAPTWTLWIGRRAC